MSRKTKAQVEHELRVAQARIDGLIAEARIKEEESRKAREHEALRVAALDQSLKDAAELRRFVALVQGCSFDDDVIMSAARFLPPDTSVHFSIGVGALRIIADIINRRLLHPEAHVTISG